MRKTVFAVLAAVSACGGDGNGSTNYDANMGSTIDAPEITPMITSFVANPSQVTAGVPTMVTWTWTYLNEPTVPIPTCSIDHNVGAVTKGQMTQITITEVTTFTLTCTNNAGTAQRQVVVGVPPVAPILSTFTVTPSAISPNTPTNVTFAWTYSNTPTASNCMIDAGVGTATNGGQVSINLPQARTFRLRCTNGAGTTYMDATVAVNECGTAAAQCNANATCTDTVNGYTCACNNNFVGDGDTCSAVVSNCTATPSQCDTNANCIGGTQCACKPGYVGSGAPNDCTRERYAFVTSTTGPGALNSTYWTGAGANTGLAAADAVCTARATALGLPGTYVAWMSDQNNDAYCRVHGLTGKKSNNCGQGALPVAAGPWIRVGDNKPFAPTIDKLLYPNHTVYYPAVFNESGVEQSTSDLVWTGTDDSGVYVPNETCSDWTSNSFSLRGTVGLTHGGGTTWTKAYSTTAAPTCDGSRRLRCMETSSGPALPPRHPTNIKRAFLTSVSGSGNFSTWADAGPTSSVAAADAVCQARARYAGYPNAGNFKAWLTYTSSYTSRVLNSSFPYVRPDGIVLGTTRSDMVDGKFAAAWNQTELNTYASGNADAGGVWTGYYYYGSPTYNYCSGWQIGTTGYYGTYGLFDVLDTYAINKTSQTCDASLRLYCIED